MCAPAAPPIRLPISNPDPNRNPNPNPRTHPNPNPIFNPNPNPFLKEQKRHRNIGQHRVIFITYFPKGRGWVYKELWTFRSQDHSLPGTFAPTNKCRPSKASSGSSTNKYRPTCT